MVILIVDKNHSYDLLVSARPGSASHCAHLTRPGTLSPLIAEKHCENPSGGTTFFFCLLSQPGRASYPTRVHLDCQRDVEGHSKAPAAGSIMLFLTARQTQPAPTWVH